MNQYARSFFSIIFDVSPPMTRKHPKKTKSEGSFAYNKNNNGIYYITVHNNNDEINETITNNSNNYSHRSTDTGRPAMKSHYGYYRMKILVVLVACCCVLLLCGLLTLMRSQQTIITSSSSSSRYFYTTTTSLLSTTKDDTASVRDLENTNHHVRTTTTTTAPPTTTTTSSSSISLSTTAQRTATKSFDYKSTSNIIVIQWSHWKDLERIVRSIWSGNLFCSTIDEIVHEYYNTRNNHTIDIQRDRTKPPIPTIHFNIELSCYDLFIESTDGTGNYIQTIYMMRLAIQYITYANLQLNITCMDSNMMDFPTNYVLPWFTGIWRSPHYVVAVDDTTGHLNHNNIQIQGEPFDVNHMPLKLHKHQYYCGSFTTTATSILYEQMIYDVRRMAIALTVHTRKMFTNPKLQQQQYDGTTLYPHRAKVLNFLRQRIYYTNTTAATTASNNNNNDINNNKREQYIYATNQQERISQKSHVVPLIQPQQKDEGPILFDDAIIHFRCGDLLSTSLNSYGFLTFHGYSRHISKTSTRSIGIVTQPFPNISDTATTTTKQQQQIQVRDLDAGNIQLVQRCQTLVYAFVEYLQKEFPNTQITIRNTKSETITLAYARMVMAKQVIGSMSTFSIFPILGTFGIGYYLRPKNYDPCMWLIHPQYPITNYYGNHHNPQQQQQQNNNNNFILFDETNIMVGAQTRNLWNTYGEDAVLEWFRTGNYTKK